MSRRLGIGLCLVVTAAAMAQTTPPPAPRQKSSFTVGWSIYAGWTPYYYMNKSGILRKWADKYGITIKVQRFDYAPSLDAFVARNIDACTMTNMEALDMPAASGVPTTIVLIGDYSNGNDALLVRNGLQLKDLAGKKLLLVQKTVSEYLFDRAMTIGGLRDQIKRVRLINTSDSDIAGAFIGDASASAVVTWKPLVSQIQKQKGITSLFNSSQIPGEILDLTVVRTDVLARPDGSGQRFAKALAGAWYEILGQMSAQSPAGDRALTAIAEGSQDTLASYKEQLSTTKMFYTPQSAVEFGSSADLKQKMSLVRQFVFDHGLLGLDMKSVDEVGIRYPDGSVHGKPDRVRLIFDQSYTQMAAQGKLEAAMSAGSLLIHAKPGRATAFLLSWGLFAGGMALYLYVAHARHLDNPEERVTPTVAQMARGMFNAAFRPSEDEEQQAPAGSMVQQFLGSMLWKDTTATARRFFYSMVLLVPAVLLGLHIGLFPYAHVVFLRFVLFFDKIVALSLLPILFIAFGIDELAKVMLIVIGVTPTIILDTFNLTRGVPGEQVVKAFTLGAGDFDVAYRVVLKQILPGVLNSIRLNLKAVMLFLFAGEMIASTDGLAYRIALLRRHMAMDVIIPYVLWVALLLFLVDFAMRWTNRTLHPWFRES